MIALVRRPALAAMLLILLTRCASPIGTGRSPAGQPRSRCVERHGLPDPRCTPGATRAGISLAIICAYHYSHSVRPPESYTEPLKLRQMRAYGLPGSPRRYEEDHLVPLSIGGAPRNPRNLWPEPRSGRYDAGQKDRLETWAARMACAHQIPLVRLQREMARDWIALYHAAGGPAVLRADPPGG